MSFWKPGTVAPGSDELAIPKSSISLVDRENEKETQVTPYNTTSKLSIQQQKLRLPIFQYKLQIQYLVEKYPVVVIVGETGCGKTTQIPQYLHESGWTLNNKVIGCTQPRRIAATSVAMRVSEETGTRLGTTVGYSIRFDECCDVLLTKIKYMTDGMLLREMMLDPLLSKYSVMMIDEAHERSLYTDIILGLLKKILRKREDLRLIISSATIDAEDMKNFFNTNYTNDSSLDTATIMSIEGRTYPVDLHYSIKPVSNYLEASIETVLDINKFEPAGDILVFLTGQEEIDKVVAAIKEKASDSKYRGTSKLRVVGLYSGIPHEKQMQVFEPVPKGTRKIVVATNIAETSVTIDGIVFVIDCGFVKIRAYDSLLGIDRLVVVPISQANAKQRAGRAGRSRAGKCYRLYTEQDYSLLSASPVPEMQRTNLSTVVLQLKAMGIDDILHFAFVSPPPVQNMIRALEILFSLGSLDEQCKLTSPMGTTMAEFPVDPYLAKMLLSSGHEYGCSEEILSIASILSVQSVFVSGTSNETRSQSDQAKRHFAVYEGDHLTLLNVYNGFIKNKKNIDWCKSHYLNFKALIRADDIRHQLKKYLKKFHVPIVSCQGDTEKILKCIVSGYFANAAVVQPDGAYKTIRGGQTLFIHPSSMLYNRTPEWVIYHEVVQTGKVYMREVSVIQPMWLSQIAQHFYDYNPAAKKFDQMANQLRSQSSDQSDQSQPAKRHRAVF